MKILSYDFRGSVRAGIAIGDWIVDLERAHLMMCRVGNDVAAEHRARQLVPSSVTELLMGGRASMAAAHDTAAFAAESLPGELDGWGTTGCVFSQADVGFRPPVLGVGKIICLGLNYRDHALEAGLTLPEAPELFAKFSNALIGHREPIQIPAVSDQVDYEAELAVVIGARASATTEADALGKVAGYTILNDVSVRDYQARTTQWLPGKSMDRTTPIGPWIVTTDQIPDPQALGISLNIDGTELQRSHTSEMAFSVAEAIAFISSVMTLDPGDIISTGTPHGVGLARDPQRWLVPGDVVSVAVDGIGTLSNPVAGAVPAASDSETSEGILQ